MRRIRCDFEPFNADLRLFVQIIKLVVMVDVVSSGKVSTKKNEENAARNRARLTVKTESVYSLYTTAKNSGQNWRSESLKLHGRNLCGFFYACKMHRAL